MYRSMPKVLLIFVLLAMAMASAPCVDAPAVASAPSTLAPEARAPMVEAHAKSANDRVHASCDWPEGIWTRNDTFAPFSSPLPSLTPFDLAWWAFLFSSIGMMSHAIPWIVFWKTSDWGATQYDSFTEGTILIEMLISLCTLGLHLFCLSELNTDTVVSEFVAVLFGMQQLYQIMERRAEGNEHYTNGDLYRLGKSFLFYAFWGCFVLLMTIFYKLQHYSPAEHTFLVAIFSVTVSSIAHVLKLIEIFFPLIHRWRANEWHDDSKVAYVAKLVTALMQITSSGFDWWNFGYNNKYWSSGYIGNKNALSLAIMSTCFGIILFFARVVGSARFKMVLGYFVNFHEDELPMVYVGDCAASSVTNDPAFRKLAFKERAQTAKLEKMSHQMDAKDAELNDMKQQSAHRVEELEELRRMYKEMEEAKVAELKEKDGMLKKMEAEKDALRNEKDSELKNKEDEICMINQHIVKVEGELKRLRELVKEKPSLEGSTSPDAQ